MYRNELPRRVLYWFTTLFYSCYQRKHVLNGLVILLSYSLQVQHVCCRDGISRRDGPSELQAVSLRCRELQRKQQRNNHDTIQVIDGLDAAPTAVPAPAATFADLPDLLQAGVPSLPARPLQLPRDGRVHPVLQG